MSQVILSPNFDLKEYILSLAGAGGAGIGGGRFAVTGDSITGSLNGLSYDWQLRGMNFPNLIPSLIGRNVRLVNNSGVPSDTSTLLLGRLQADCLKYKPDYVHVLIGTNDAGNAVPLSTYQSNMQAIADKIRAAGAVPIIGNLLARDFTLRDAIANYNAWIYNWTAREKLPLVDYYNYSVDYTTGGIKAGIASDSLHPTPGAPQRLLATFAANSLSGMFKARPFYLSQFAPSADGVTTRDPENLIKAGCMNLDTNSDGVSDFWTPTGSTGTFTMGTDSAYIIGRYQQEAKVSVTGNTNNKTPSLTGWSAGDLLSYAGLIRCTGFEAGGTTIYMRLSNNSNIHMSYAGWGYDTDGFTATGGWIPFYIEGKVPAGSTSINANYQFSGTAATGTFQMAQLTVQNLTTSGEALW